MPLYLTRSACLQTCTDHEDCRSCRELADACHESRTGRPAGSVEVDESHEWSRMHEGETVIAIGVHTYGKDVDDGESTRAGRSGYRSYLALTENYIGRVVELEESCEKIMGDVYDTGFWAWCAKDDGTFVKVYMGCSYGRECNSGSYGFCSHAIVDAPLALIDRWNAWMIQQAEERRLENNRKAEERHRQAAEEEARTPRKGRTLRVVKGRKVPVGTVGTCMWVGSTKYGDRVGIRVEGVAEPYWTSTLNVEVVRA